MSEASDAELVARLRAANTRLRELLTAKDVELEALRSEKDAENAELRTGVAVVDGAGRGVGAAAGVG